MNRRTFVSSSALAAGVVFRGGMPIAQAAKLSSEAPDPRNYGRQSPRRADRQGFLLQRSSLRSAHHGQDALHASREGRTVGRSEGCARYRPARSAASRQSGSRISVMERTEPMGGDCLCVNVFTTGINDGRKRPVMFWLHGGGFPAGSGGGNVLYDGSNLALKHDVAVVTVNHRLNVFGFMYLADIGGERFAQASNAGMLDVVLALEWVRDNAAAFGGDPGNVTIFGQSGGGSKVSTLLGMPAAKGLFHHAIAMSGSEVTGIPRDEASKAAEAVMKKLGLKDVADLQTVPMLKLLALTRPGAIGMPWRLGPWSTDVLCPPIRSRPRRPPFPKIFRSLSDPRKLKSPGTPSSNTIQWTMRLCVPI